MCPPALVVGDGYIVNENNTGKNVYLHFHIILKPLPQYRLLLFFSPWDETNNVDEILLWKTLLEPIQSYYF
jgi:hypothetical protein